LYKSNHRNIYIRSCRDGQKCHKNKTNDKVLNKGVLQYITVISQNKITYMVLLFNVEKLHHYVVSGTETE